MGPSCMKNNCNFWKNSTLASENIDTVCKAIISFISVRQSHTKNLSPNDIFQLFNFIKSVTTRISVDSIFNDSAKELKVLLKCLYELAAHLTPIELLQLDKSLRVNQRNFDETSSTIKDIMSLLKQNIRLPADDFEEFVRDHREIANPTSKLLQVELHNFYTIISEIYYMRSSERGTDDFIKDKSKIFIISVIETGDVRVFQKKSYQLTSPLEYYTTKFASQSLLEKIVNLRSQYQYCPDLLWMLDDNILFWLKDSSIRKHSKKLFTACKSLAWRILKSNSDGNVLTLDEIKNIIYFTTVYAFLLTNSCITNKSNEDELYNGLSLLKNILMVIKPSHLLGLKQKQMQVIEGSLDTLKHASQWNEVYFSIQISFALKSITAWATSNACIVKQQILRRLNSDLVITSEAKYKIPPSLKPDDIKDYTLPAWNDKIAKYANIKELKEAAPDSDNCPMCFDPLDLDFGILATCPHIYCLQCLESWFSKPNDNNE